MVKFAEKDLSRERPYGRSREIFLSIENAQ